MERRRPKPPAKKPNMEALQTNITSHSRTISALEEKKETMTVNPKQPGNELQRELSMSPRSLSTNLYTFKLPKFDPSIYVQFIDQLIFGGNRKEAIMQPIPPAVGQLKFTITRNKSKLNKLKPSFYLNLEKNNGGKILVLYAKKMPFMKSSYYLISLEKNKSRVGPKKEADTCLGKLRAIDSDNEQFVLYDNGENFAKKGVQYKDIRKEHGTFIYRYEPCNVGNIRKMIILFPAITCIRLQRKADASRQDGISDSAMTNDQENTKFNSV